MSASILVKNHLCAAYAAGYRDKRELKKHQITHNHLDTNSESPNGTSVSSNTTTSSAVVVAAPAPAPTQLTLVAPPPQPHPPPQQPAVSTRHTAIAVSPTKPIMVPATSTAQQNNPMATITFSLPTEPVPKNQLGLAPDPPQPQVYTPLNPAQIQLPPSVAAALQNMNNKVASKQVNQPPAGMILAAAPTTPVKQEAVLSGGHIIKQIGGHLLEGDGNQLTLAAAAGSFPGLISSGGPQVFYYVMPPNSVAPLSTGGEGGGTQFLALPAGAIQATVPVSSVSGAFPQWIIGDSSGLQTGGSGTPSGGRSAAM